MATPPDFNVGDVLTAQDINAVGLWRITGCTVTSAGGTSATASNGVVTIGSGNTSVTVNNAFSSDFDNYRIIISGTTFTNGGGGIRFNLGGTVGGANYHYGGILINTATGALTGAPGNNVGFVLIGTTTSTNAHANILDVLLPQKALRTTIIGGLSYGETNSVGPIYAIHNADTAFTSFTYYPTNGTMSGGTIRVYGYRN